MIKSINTHSSIWLECRNSSATPYISPGSMSAGMMRYNPGNYNVEVYDGNSWFVISGTADVNLTPEAQKIMEWARNKMTEEEQLQKLMEKHPGLKDLHEKFELMKALVAEDHKNS